MRIAVHIIERVSTMTGEYGSLVYLIVFVVTIMDVVGRYFFNAPSVWGLELVIALAGIHYVMAGAEAIKSDGHVRIDAIYKILPTRIQRLMDVLSSALTFTLMLVITYYGVQQAYPSVIGGETSGAGWNSHAPMWMKVAIPLGAALMALQSCVQLARNLKKLTNVR